MRLFTAPWFECANLHYAVKTTSSCCAALVVHGARYTVNSRTDTLRLICRKLE